MNQGVLLLLGLCYALIFLAVAVRNPGIALCLIFASAPFQNDVSGGGPLKFSLAEINLLLSLPVLVVKSRRLHLGPSFAPAMLYLGTCLFSILGQWRDSTASSMVQIGIYTVVAVAVFASLAKNQEDYRLALNGAIAVAVFFALTMLVLRTAFIFGLHKNGVGATLSAAFVIAFEMCLSAQTRKARWVYACSCGLIAFGCLTTLSRGAWLGAITGAFVVLAMRRKFGLMLKSALALAPVLVLGWLLLPHESREYAVGFSAEKNYNIKMRFESIDFAWERFLSNPLQGVGVGLRKDYDATNVVLLTLAETGVPGLAAFLLLHLTVLVVIWRGYPRMPPDSFSASILAIALALTAGKFIHGIVDHYWGRGTLTMVWASVGMAARVLYDQKMLRRRLARARAAGLPPLDPPVAAGAAAAP